MRHSQEMAIDSRTHDLQFLLKSLKQQIAADGGLIFHVFLLRI